MKKDPVIHPVLRRRPAVGVIQLAAAMRRALQVELGDEGIGIEAGLMLLVAAELGALAQQALGERAGRDRTTVSEALDTLEYDGLVTRAPDPMDRRRRLVRLTDAGAGVAQAATPALERAERSALKRLNARERARLGQLVERALPRTRPPLWEAFALRPE